MQTSLEAAVRTPEVGKSVARKLRKAGRVPAVVYGPGEETRHITVDPDALTEIFRHSRDRNTIVDLQIEGESVPTLVRVVQRHPLSRDVLHVDFYRVSKDRAVEVEVPVGTTGRAAGEVLGGRVRVIRRTLTVRCRYDRIPERILVDVSPLQVGDLIRATDVATPEGVELVIENDFPVVSLVGKRVAAAAKTA